MKFFRKVKNWFGSSERRFDAARIDRTTADWILSPVKTNDDIRANLMTLRMRSRDLAKNNSDYRKWLDMRKKNVVGAQGVQMQSKIMNPPDRQGQVTQDRVANEIIEREWKAWGALNNHACTVDGSHSWHTACILADRAMAVDGECFIRIVRGFDNPWRFSLQFIDADAVDVQYNHARQVIGGPEIVMGVERNGWGRPVAYHLRSFENRDYGERIRIPADEMIHLFETEFIGQARGFPKGCAAILDMNMSAAYREAELIAARVSACSMGVWIRPPNATGKLNFDGADSDKATMDMEPGKFAIAPKGWDLKSVAPTHPGTQTHQFLKVIGRSISNGLGVSYNDFANDLESVSYSSLRGGALSERDGWKMDQQYFIDAFCKRINRAWLEQLLLIGKTILPMSKIEKFDAAVFLPRRWDWVDPLRDIKADREAIDLKVLSPQDVIREAGRDPEEVLEDLQMWKELMAKYDIEPTEEIQNNEQK